MKIVLLLSAFVALALAEDRYEAAYAPLGTDISFAPSPRIVGGQNAARNQFPYQISLQRRVNANQFAHVCGGSIVSPTWVLSAAHCTVPFSAANLRVVAGILLLTDSNIAGQQIRNVQQLINHPLYPGNNQVAPNDISLIRLASLLSYTVNVQPIAIPPAGLTSTGTGVLSGWGLLNTGGVAPNNLQFANLPIVPEVQCNNILNGLLWNNPFSIQLNLCSGPAQPRQAACSGDSGGPYVHNGRVIGVVSWGLTPCGNANAPSVYVKTSAYTNWIITNTNGDVRP